MCVCVYSGRSLLEIPAYSDCVCLPVTESFIFVNQKSAHTQYVIKLYWTIYFYHVYICRPLWEDICHPSKISKQCCPKHQVAPHCGWWHTYQVFFHYLELFFSPFPTGAQCFDLYISPSLSLKFDWTFFCLTAMEKLSTVKRENMFWIMWFRESSRNITILSNIQKAQYINSSPTGLTYLSGCPFMWKPLDV